MTFSIVAVDLEKKELGFAIASCFWNAGQVGFVLAGKGAIVSQAQGNMSFISLFFEKLEENMTVKEILEVFRNSDENFEKRQIGMISSTGDVIAYSGNEVYSAFQRIGKDYACQGNILIGRDVVESMADAFEKTEGSLTNRLYAALQAGDNSGGDMRGKISARLHVVKDRGNPYYGTVTDFTIEEHEEPVREIGRLLALEASIIRAWKLTDAASKAEGKDKQAAVIELEEYLSDKHDRLFSDFHSSLASLYLELDRRDKAVEC
jgi:uncharacterized Ntn-hydrolase superfamily protein